MAKVWRNIYFVPLFKINFWEGCRQVCFKKSYVWHVHIKKLHAIMRIMLSMPPSLHSLFYIRFLLPYSIKPKNIWHVDSENVFKKFLWCTFFLPFFEKVFNVLSSSFNWENYLYFDILSKLSLFRSVSQQINTCSKSTIKTAERHHWHRPSVFIVKVEHNLFLLLTLNK